MRARAFCIDEILKRPEHIKQNTRASKNEIFKLVKREFPDQSAKTVYEALINSAKELNKEFFQDDYKYGIQLFKTKYPDS
jgi:predicted Ser/Thr protein kinase